MHFAKSLHIQHALFVMRLYFLFCLPGWFFLSDAAVKLISHVKQHLIMLCYNDLKSIILYEWTGQAVPVSFIFFYSLCSFLMNG